MFSLKKHNKRTSSTSSATMPKAAPSKKLRTQIAPATPKTLVKLPPLKPVSTRPVPLIEIDPRAAPLARKILSDIWGYSAFRLAQENAISRLICGGSALVVFPTGGGKSLVYQVPALAFYEYDEICGRRPGKGVTLVVSPLIALMKDQTEALKKRGVAAAALDSTQSKEDVMEIYRMLRSEELKLLYVAPERLNNEAFVEMIKGVKIRMVAVDEAHCISEWGHAFRPEYRKVARFVEEVSAERVLCLTATATRKVCDDILREFHIPEEDLFRTTTFRPNLKLRAVAVESESEKMKLLKEFLSKNPGPTIVYVITHQQAVDTASALQNAEFDAAPYHAGMSNDTRSSVQERFMRSNDMVIVATIAFGMGVDKANIRSVVHYTIPKSLEGYSQEIGRADVMACHQPVFEFQGAEEDHVVEANMHSLGRDWDIRANTLTLLFAELELRFGLLRAITPKYSTYTYAPTPLFGSLSKTGDIEKALISASRVATKLTHVDVDEAMRRCGHPRELVVHKLQNWEQDGAIELKPRGVINRFRVLKSFPTTAQIAELAQQAHEQMETREAENIERLKQVVDMLTGYECFAEALAGYFGDNLEEACGSCGFCETNRPVEFEWPGNDEGGEVDMKAVEMVLNTVGKDNHDDARFLARIGWGISSPRATALKLSKTPAWGCCKGMPFEKLVKVFQMYCKE
ncbi:P-loop containing nucleoside triphosphate hydrolase protein [Trichophaea hybrida]|nr:P-loop containing nucleoside triphosphate hydrolase protein [Trichophaea hybrida]